jgi:hypothetical protein
VVGILYERCYDWRCMEGGMENRVEILNVSENIQTCKNCLSLTNFVDEFLRTHRMEILYSVFS